MADLAEQAKELERRTGEIAALADAEPLPAPPLDGLRGELHAALENGTPTRVKAMLQALTDEVRIDARDAIEPIFRVPAVRPPSRSVRLTGGRLKQSPTWRHISELHDKRFNARAPEAN